MPIAGVVVIPHRKEMSGDLADRMKSFEEIEVQDVGDSGIAAVLESADLRRLQEISEEIEGWEDVVEFNLAYLNWEDDVTQ